MPDTAHYESCRKVMRFLKFTTKWRFIITAFSVVINSLMYFIHMFSKATIEFSPQNTYLSFVFLIASLVLGAGILYLAAHASAAPEKPKLLCLLIGLLLLARVTNVLLNVFSFLLLLWATQFLEVKKAKWLIEQEGYPYFNERFEQQKEQDGYVPTYSIGTQTTDSETAVSGPAEMPGIPEIPDLPDS